MRLWCGRNLRHGLLGRGQTTARRGIVRRQFDCATSPALPSPALAAFHRRPPMDSRHLSGANWDSRHLGGSRMRFHLPFRFQHLDQRGDDGIALAHLDRLVIGIERTKSKAWSSWPRASDSNSNPVPVFRCIVHPFRSLIGSDRVSPSAQPTRHVADNTVRPVLPYACNGCPTA